MTEQPRIKTAAELLAETGFIHEMVLDSSLDLADDLEHHLDATFLDQADHLRVRYLVAYIREMDAKNAIDQAITTQPPESK